MPLEHHLKWVFPGGFDSKPSNSESKSVSKHLTHTTGQLSIALVDHYNPINHSDSIIVKSAWFGKQTQSPRHEFILLQVEDHRSKKTYPRGLINYLVLDRNVHDKSVKSGKSIGYSRTSIEGGQAVDSFKVSYDGNVMQLLNDCQLNPYRLVEKLQFPSEQPLFLYELVTLAHFVSSEHPTYHAINTSCYFFAGLIWDSLHILRPEAILIKSLGKEKGKHGWYRYVVDKSQVDDTCKEASKRILEAKSNIENQKAALQDMVKELLAEAGVSTAASS